MIEKLDFMVRFWQLRARHEASGEALTAAERLELLSLLRMMATDQRLPERGPLPYSTGHGLPVQLTAPGGFIASELRLVCADGIVLSCVTPLRVGDSTMVRLADAVAGVEYTLPCVVAWVLSGAPSTMALRVDGSPSRLGFAIPMPGMWRSPLGRNVPRLRTSTE